MADWDANSPEDSDIVSQYPANERAARQAVADNFAVDHHSVNDGDVGKHAVIQILDEEADPTIDAGDVGLWNNGGVLKTRTGAGAATPVDAFPSGTKMLFYQADAPTGWTQDVAINDRVLRVVDGDGGGSGGSWTISGVTVDGHALTIAEMPLHGHGGQTGSNGAHNHTLTRDSGNLNNSGSGFRYTLADRQLAETGSTSTAPNHVHTISSQGGGNTHTHGLTADGAWRPAYIDVIAAAKD